MPGIEERAPDRTDTRRGSVGVTEFRAHDLLDLGHRRVDLGFDGRRVGLVVVVVIGADLGGEGEAGRHRNAEAGHLGQVGALAAEQVFHFRLAVGGAAAKRIHVLRVVHYSPPSTCSFERSASSMNCRPSSFKSAIRLSRTRSSSHITSTSTKKRSRISAIGSMATKASSTCFFGSRF